MPIEKSLTRQQLGDAAQSGSPQSAKITDMAALRLREDHHAPRGGDHGDVSSPRPSPGAVSSHVQPKRGSQKRRSQHDGTLPGLHASETSGAPRCFTRFRGAASAAGRARQRRCRCVRRRVGRPSPRTRQPGRTWPGGSRSPPLGALPGMAPGAGDGQQRGSRPPCYMGRSRRARMSTGRC